MPRTPTPVKNGRGVLLPIPNVPDMNNASDTPTKPADLQHSTHPKHQPVTKPSTSQNASSNTMQRPNLNPTNPQRRSSVSSLARPPLPKSSPALRRASIAAVPRPLPSPGPTRPSLSSLASKRARPSPSAKRVSFGSNTINFINQHKNEFTSPSAHSSNDSGSEGSPTHHSAREQNQDSPPRKLVKHSVLSSPSVSKSLKIAVNCPDLPSNEHGESGHVAAEPSQPHSQALSPRPGRQSTPIPPLRASMARARQSFGIFLDDDVTSGRDLDDRFGSNKDDDLDRSYSRINVGDGCSPQSASPGSDLTQDLVTHISALMDKDESAMNDNAPHPPTTGNPTPQLPSVTASRSPMNSRKSLAYVGDKKLIFDSKRDELRGLTNRLSIAPIGAEHRAYQFNDESPDDSFQEDQTLNVGNILDRLELDEEEERRAIDVHNTNPGRSESDRSLQRPVLPENRKLFDLEAADETIHYYDLDNSNNTMKVDRQVEGQNLGRQEQQPHSPHVATHMNPASDISPQQQEKHPSYAATKENCESNVAPQQPQTLSSDAATKETPANEAATLQQQIHNAHFAPKENPINEVARQQLQTKHFHLATTEKPAVEIAPQQQQTPPPHVSTGKNPVNEVEPQQQLTRSPRNEVVQHEDETNSSFWVTSEQSNSPRIEVAHHEEETNSSFGVTGEQIHSSRKEVAHHEAETDSSVYVRSENAGRKDTRIEQTYPEKPQSLQIKSTATLTVANQIESGKVLATPLPDARSTFKSTAEICRPPTPHSETGLKIRAGFKEGMSASKRSQADSQIQELSNSVLRGSKPDCIAQKSAIQPTLQFTVSEFLSECNVHFDQTFAVDQREASIIGSSSDDIDRTSMQSRILESVKREKILRRLQEEATKQTKVVKELEHRMLKLEDELMEKMPPAYALVSRGNSLSSREMSTFRMSMKRLRKVSSTQVRMAWVLSRQRWEGAIRDEIQKVLTEGDRYVSELVTSEGAYGKLNRKFKEVLRGNGVQFDDLGDLGDSAAVVSLRKEVSTEFAYTDDLRKLVLEKKEMETDLQRRKNYLADRTTERTKSVKRLRDYAGAMLNNNLKEKVTERAELNMMMSRIAGFRPHVIHQNGIKAAVADLLDLELKFDGDVVTDVVMNSFPVDGREPVIQAFVDGASTACRRSMQGLNKVRDVPFALYVCRERLSSLKLFLLNLSRYFDSHLGELTGSHLHEDKISSTLSVSFRGSFFSLRKWTKFDVSITVSTVIPKQCDGTLSQELKLDAVTRFIGPSPAVETLDNVIQEAGFQRDGEMFNAADAFAAVWGLLEPPPNESVVSSLNS